MLKKLAAIGLGAALIFAPMASFADTAPTPAATTAPMKKVVHHHVVKKVMVKKVVVKHHVVKHHVVKHMVKKPMVKKPMPAPTATPKS